MKSRTVLFLGMACVIATGLCLSSGQAFGTPYQGVSDVSWGRFAAWSTMKSDLEYFEEDLVKRIYADRIEKTHKDLEYDESGVNLPYIWTLHFGATSGECDPDSIPDFDDDLESDTSSVNIWPEEQNWVYKKFAVVREGAPVGGQSPPDQDHHYRNREYTYTVSVNSLGPGTRIQTKNPIFYLENNADKDDHKNHGFGYAACRYSWWPWGPVKVKGDFSDNPETFWGMFIRENWILFFDSQSSKYTKIIPVLVSFSDRPYQIRCDADYIEVDFNDNDEKTIFISLPFGADGVDTTSVFDPEDPWTDGLPQDVIDRCRLINRMVNNWPVDVDEDFKFEETTPGEPDRVFISNQFTYSYMGGYWGVSNEPYSLIPPLVALAEQVGLDVTIPSRYMTQQAVDIGFPTKSGPLLMVDLSDSVEYEIPGAPEHDVHLVGVAGETEWKQRVNRMVNQAALDSDNYSKLLGGIFTNANNRGETASLAMTRDWTQAHYVDWMKQIITKRIIKLLPPPGIPLEWDQMDWEGINPPGEGEWPRFWAYMFKDVPKRVPFDIDAQMGVILEFIYEYGLWSGDWETLDDHWTSSPHEILNIPEFFKPLEIFHDWAYMAISHDVFGGEGAHMDMFPAQLAGYDAFAKIAAALGHDEEAARGRYLAAKAQIPFVTRWAAKAYVSYYYHTFEDQIIKGFGEEDPSGPLANNEIRTIENWADWTISGERIHLLGYDILRTMVDDQSSFESALESFYALAEDYLNPLGSHKIAGFAEDKLYSFYKWKDRLTGMNQETLTALIEKTYTDRMQDPSTGSIKGASFLYYKCRATDWGSGTRYCSVAGDGSPRIAETFPLMPAIVEAYGVPVRVGAWAPARLNTASYDPGTETFTAEFELVSSIPGAPDPIVRLQVDTQPSQVTVDGGSGTITYDPLWQVVEIPLTGNGPWTVAAVIPPVSGTGWDPAYAEPNLISDPGFEDSGSSQSLDEVLPNMELGWGSWAPDGHVYTTNEESHSGDQCALLTIPEEDDLTQLYQYVWVKPTESVDEILINLDFWYKVDGDEKLKLGIAEFPNEIGPYEYYHGTSLLQKDLIWEWDPEDPEGYEGPWQHFSKENLRVTPESSVVEVRFTFTGRAPFIEGEHEMYLDDVVLTCPILDEGGGGNGGEPPIHEVSSPLPVLSNVTVRPNPFNPSTVIGFQLGQSNRVSLKIYDALGRVVRTLVEKRLPAGNHSITWDGSNNNGEPSASGVYFYKLSVADKVVRGKLALLK